MDRLDLGFSAVHTSVGAKFVRGPFEVATALLGHGFFRGHGDDDDDNDSSNVATVPVSSSSFTTGFFFSTALLCLVGVLVVILSNPFAAMLEVRGKSK
jgi:hypothetical protein